MVDFYNFYGNKGDSVILMNYLLYIDGKICGWCGEIGALQSLKYFLPLST